MALAVNRTGTIFKKCDRSNHRPESNKNCATGTCRHTCDKPDRCPHAWTLRYWVSGKQLERSFKDTTNASTGRVNYGTGRKLTSRPGRPPAHHRQPQPHHQVALSTRIRYTRPESACLSPLIWSEDVALGSDPYAVLGIARDATDVQIHQARHQLVRKYHPDVNHGPDAAARFDEVQQAFNLLSDPVARAEFDRTNDEHGRTRLLRAANGGYGPDGEAASSVRIEPASVDFGVLTPQRPWATATVTITWTGTPPENITCDTDGEWWRVASSIRPRSSREYCLLAESHSGKPIKGQQHAQFTVTVNGTVLTVELSAEFQGDFSEVTKPSPTGPPQPAPDVNPQPSRGVQPATRNYELVHGALFLGLLLAAFIMATLGMIFHWAPHRY